jgi:hypothetical protein
MSLLDGDSTRSRRDKVLDARRLLQKSFTYIPKTVTFQDVKYKQKLSYRPNKTIGTGTNKQVSSSGGSVIGSRVFKLRHGEGRSTRSTFLEDIRLPSSKIIETETDDDDIDGLGSLRCSNSCYFATLANDSSKSELFDNKRDDKVGYKSSEKVIVSKDSLTRVPLSRRFGTRWQLKRSNRRVESNSNGKNICATPIPIEGSHSNYSIQVSGILDVSYHRRYPSAANTEILSDGSDESCQSESDSESCIDDSNQSFPSSIPIKDSLISKHSTFSLKALLHDLASVVALNVFNIGSLIVTNNWTQHVPKEPSDEKVVRIVSDEPSHTHSPPTPSVNRIASVFSSNGNELINVRASLRRTSSRSPEHSPSSSFSSSPLEEDPEFRESVIKELETLMKGDISNSSIESNIVDFVMGNFLGRGKCASVRVATGIDGRIVAIKEFSYLRDEPPIAVLQGFQLEIEAMKVLTNCPNIVQLYGIWLQPRPCIVMELLEDGCLHDAIFSDVLESVPAKKWNESTSSCKLDLIHQVATGLMAMHSKNVIHRDIKSHNIVIAFRQSGWIAKIADFGSAIILNETGLTTGKVGTSGWSAPEIFSSKFYGVSCDIFSLAILIWESGYIGENIAVNPLCGMEEDEYTSKLASGLRPPILNENNFNMPFEAYNELLQRSWEQDPRLRFSAMDIVDFLGKNLL